jgi:N-acetylmuramoyl-L-alanine amidase
LAALLVLVGLVAGGCGSSKTETAADSAAASVTSTTTSSTSTTRAKPKPKPKPLAGKVVGIDPGHNGRNYTDPSYLNHLIWNGREEEGCDTTGTQTDSRYTEAQFNWNVARYLTTDLKAEGAKVALTRHSNNGIGPCVNTRADIINRAHANVASDIHADGGPVDGRGVAVLLPVADGPNDHVIAASKRFGRILLGRYRALTHMPDSTYDGVDGFEPRDDLAGLNLTRVPKVLIECGNMRNATDAALLVRSSYQRLTAKSFAEAITEYLIGRR